MGVRDPIEMVSVGADEDFCTVERDGRMVAVSKDGVLAFGRSPLEVPLVPVTPDVLASMATLSATGVATLFVSDDGRLGMCGAMDSPEVKVGLLMLEPGALPVFDFPDGGTVLVVTPHGNFHPMRGDNSSVPHYQVPLFEMTRELFESMGRLIEKADKMREEGMDVRCEMITREGGWLVGMDLTWRGNDGGDGDA